MTTREERLTALEEAVTRWTDIHIASYEEQAEFLRSVFAGRTPSGRLSEYVSTHASSLLEIL